MTKSIIAVDFDGTCVAFDYPRIGTSIGAEYVLQRLVEAGHSIVLNTMRSGEELKETISWFKAAEIPLIGANKTPGQELWTKSPKVYAHIYIDDAALGCPLTHDFTINDSPFVDWVKVGEMLEQAGFFRV